MNKRLQSYTISELLVVLVITSIVVGIAFSVLNLTRRQIEKINRNKEFETQIKQAELKLSIDINSFSEAKIEGKNLFLKRETDSIEYQISDDKLIVSQDTLLTNIVKLNYFYKGQEINNGTFDACKITIESKKNKDTTIFVYKINDAVKDFNSDGF